MSYKLSAVMATLVTGLGYIGSALAARLLAQGEEVVGLENFFSTSPGQPAPLSERGLRMIEGSITDSAAVDAAFSTAPITSVFHLAAQASAQDGAAPIQYTQETNYSGPRVLLDACLAHGVHRVVFASSTRLYRTPLPNTLSEDAPIAPTDLVHLSHLYGELLLEAYRPLGIHGAAARIGIVHGVGPVMKTDERFLAVPQRFCLRAARGEPLRVTVGPASEVALVHVEDAVQALLCLRDAPSDLAVANVAQEVRSVADVARAVAVAAQSRGMSVEAEYEGSSETAEPRKIVSALDGLGFKPRRRLEESLADVLDYYLGVGARGPGVPR